MIPINDGSYFPYYYLEHCMISATSYPACAAPLLLLLFIGSSLGLRLAMSSVKKQSPYYTKFPQGSKPQLHAPKGLPGSSAEDAWESYHEMYRQSLDEPEKFWTEQSNKYLKVSM